MALSDFLAQVLYCLPETYLLYPGHLAYMMFWDGTNVAWLIYWMVVAGLFLMISRAKRVKGRLGRWSLAFFLGLLVMPSQYFSGALLVMPPLWTAYLYLAETAWAPGTSDVAATVALYIGVWILFHSLVCGLLLEVFNAVVTWWRLALRSGAEVDIGARLIFWTKYLVLGTWATIAVAMFVTAWYNPLDWSAVGTLSAYPMLFDHWATRASLAIGCMLAATIPTLLLVFLVLWVLSSFGRSDGSPHDRDPQQHAPPDRSPAARARVR